MEQSKEEGNGAGRSMLSCFVSRSFLMTREDVTTVEHDEVFGSMSARVSTRGANARRGGFAAEEYCVRRAWMRANQGSKSSHEQPKEERNGAGYSRLSCFISHPCSMIGEEVTAAEQEEVFGSMSAVVSARGVNARRGGFVVEGCCMRRAGMGANKGV